MLHTVSIEYKIQNMYIYRNINNSKLNKEEENKRKWGGRGREDMVKKKEKRNLEAKIRF
jgi:hypothetical protein